MMKSLNHTFAVLAYGESPYLEECLISLKAQTVPSHIFISTSTPSSFLENLAEKYNIPVKVVERGRGIASDWSFAYNSCTTPYATLAHQDDVYLPHYTEQCLKAADMYPASLILFTDYCELSGGHHRELSVNLMIKRSILLFFYILKDNLRGVRARNLMLAFGNPVSCPSVLFHREKIGNFEFSNDFAYNLDWDAWFRLSQLEGEFLYVGKRLMLHRIHSESELVKGTASRERLKEDMQLFEKYWPKPLAKVIAALYTFFVYRTSLKGGA